jgi:hypothetical protein
MEKLLEKQEDENRVKMEKQNQAHQELQNWAE